MANAKGKHEGTTSSDHLMASLLTARGKIQIPPIVYRSLLSRILNENCAAKDYESLLSALSLDDCNLEVGEFSLSVFRQEEQEALQSGGVSKIFESCAGLKDLVHKSDSDAAPHIKDMLAFLHAIDSNGFKPIAPFALQELKLICTAADVCLRSEADVTRAASDGVFTTSSLKAALSKLKCAESKFSKLMIHPTLQVVTRLVGKVIGMLVADDAAIQRGVSIEAAVNELARQIDGNGDGDMSPTDVKSHLDSLMQLTAELDSLIARATGVTRCTMQRHMETASKLKSILLDALGQSSSRLFWADVVRRCRGGEQSVPAPEIGGVVGSDAFEKCMEAKVSVANALLPTICCTEDKGVDLAAIKFLCTCYEHKELIETSGESPQADAVRLAYRSTNPECASWLSVYCRLNKLFSVRKL